MPLRPSGHEVRAVLWRAVGSTRREYVCHVGAMWRRQCAEYAEKGAAAAHQVYVGNGASTEWYALGTWGMPRSAFGAMEASVRCLQCIPCERGVLPCADNLRPD